MWKDATASGVYRGTVQLLTTTLECCTSSGCIGLEQVSVPEVVQCFALMALLLVASFDVSCNHASALNQTDRSANTAIVLSQRCVLKCRYCPPCRKPSRSCCSGVRLAMPNRLRRSMTRSSSASPTAAMAGCCPTASHGAPDLPAQCTPSWTLHSDQAHSASCMWAASPAKPCQAAGCSLPAEHLLLIDWLLPVHCCRLKQDLDGSVRQPRSISLACRAQAPSPQSNSSIWHLAGTLTEV